MSNYEITIFYSAEDGGYIAEVPDLEYCSAFGRTPAEALAEVERARDAWLAAARDAGRPLSICGEMAGDPAYTELLLGLGLREFSVAPGEMLEVKNAIRTVTLADAEALAAAALEL